MSILMRLSEAIFSATNSDFVQPPSKGDPSEGSGEPSDSETQDEGAGDGEDADGGEEDEDGEGKTKGSGEEDEDGTEEDGDGSGDTDTDTDDDTDTDTDDADTDDADDTGDDDFTGNQSSQEGTEDGTDTPNSQEAGGETGTSTVEDIANALINAMEAGEETGLADNNSALQDAIEGGNKDENCEDEEQVWRPYNPSLDTISHPKSRNIEKARRLQSQVKKEIAYLTSKLRSKFLQARSPQVVHGVRHGRELSERRLVESVTEIRSGRRPTRPDWDRVNKPECSLAVAVVLDQSGSMTGDEANVARAALAIATPMDKLGCSCLVVGPRGGRYGGNVDNDFYDESGSSWRSAKFHRSTGVHMDVFKGWDEPMRKALPRFAAVQASGGTPLSDGIQFAMQELSLRSERHRVILVLTDGRPNNPNVVTRQIRLAKESGVTIVGVGISGGCYQVPHQFPDNHVAVEQISDLPRNMLAVLDAIMFPSRAKRIKLDGKLSGARLLTA
jgi:hypothetical protein